jgi:hypothetical protein
MSPFLASGLLDLSSRTIESSWRITSRTPWGSLVRQYTDLALYEAMAYLLSLGAQIWFDRLP